MLIRKTTKNDIDSLMPIFDEARGTIAALGIDQWQDGYPSRSVIEKDVELGESFLVELDGKICGTFVLLERGEPTYDKIYDGRWLTGESKDGYIAMHRVAISVANRGSGISGEMIAFAAEMARRTEKTSIRIDTHEGNRVMRKMLENKGFTHTGTIFLEKGDKRVAYEKLV